VRDDAGFRDSIAHERPRGGGIRFERADKQDSALDFTDAQLSLVGST
jgi:hypothetical protein